MRPLAHSLLRCLLYFVLPALLPVSLPAQSLSAVVKGYIFDARTKGPLTGAVISLLPENRGTGTVTDTSGYFVLSNVPVGYQSLQVSYIGYETFIEKSIYVSTGRENVLEIFLTPSDQVLDAVMVSAAQATTADLSLVRLQPIKQGERLAGGFNDVGRMLLSYAGVQTILDGSNQIVVRGTGPFGFGWRINGIPMADPNHFSSTAQSGGAIGLISTYVLEKADFYSGAIPANMGNALSGVMDMQLRKGDREKFNANLRLGMVGLDAMLEGPFSKKKKASYLANYRFSTITLIEKMGINVHGTEFTSGDISTNFQDLCIGVHIPVGERVSIQPFLIAGRSKSINDFSSANNRREDNFYRMATTGVSVQHRVNDQWSWRSTLALEMVQFKLFAAQRFTYPFMSKFADRSFDDNRENAVTISQKWSAEATYQPTVKHKLQAGGLMQYFDFDFNFRDYAWWALDLDEDGQADSVYVTDTIEAGSGSLKSWYYEFFLNWQYKLSTRWVLETGLQFNQAVFNKHTNLEPRLKLTFRPARNHTLSLATGMQSRLLPYVYYAASLYNVEDPQPNRGTDFEKVVHLVLGYSWQFRPDVILKAEFYFQYLYAIPVEIPGSPGYDPHYSPLNDVFAWYWKPVVSEGKGRNYGMELTLEKVFSRNYYIISTLSLYSSRYKTLAAGWHPTTYDGRFIYNISGGRDFIIGKNSNHLLSLNSKLIWAGGGRYRGVAEMEGGGYAFQAGYAEKLKDYFRWDLKLSYRKNKPRSSWEISAEVQNVLNRRNEYKKEFDFFNGQYNTNYHIGILPVAKFSVEL